MVYSGEFIGLLVLVASAAALGLSIMFDVGRVSAERTRASVLQRQIDKKTSALKEWTAKTAACNGELSSLRARVAEFANRKQMVQAELKALEFTKVEMVHELGECDGAAIGYWAQLTVSPATAETERRDMVFSRQLWNYRNCAHVWAGSAQHAMTLLRTSFPERSGIVATQFLPLAQAPDAAESGGAP